MMEHIPFMGKVHCYFILSQSSFPRKLLTGVEDEDRFQEIINEWIESEEVTEFKAFTNEPKSKRDRRHKKYARESKEAEAIKEKLKNQQNDENDLAKQIMKRQEERSSNSGSFLAKLMEKYGGAEDDDEVDIRDLGRRTQKNKKKVTPGKEKKETPIKAGRVSKRNK